jgi:choline transport protein
MTAMVIHVTMFFVTMIVLLACTSPKHSASYVFTNFSNTSGWKSNGVAFCVGLLSTVYGFIGIEMPAHFAEEMKHAPRNLPKASTLLVDLTAELQLLINISQCS